MQNDYGAPTQSSLLAHPIAIALWFACCVVTAFFGHSGLSVFFGFVCALALCSFLWGRFSLRKLCYDVIVSPGGVYPGQDINVTRTLTNGKLLPLIWLELLEPCNPTCAAPDEQFIITEEHTFDEQTIVTYRCFYKFSLIKWHQQLTWRDTWRANRRGIHRITDVTLRSGDGFGLCVQSRRLKSKTAGQIVVYPAPVDVSLEKILNDMWDTRSDSHGYFEDITLIKSTRDYAPSDPARRINQRLLARGQGLKVNLYETVEPNSALFILDAASFVNHTDDFEAALSIIASLIEGLSHRGIQAGLVTPASDYFEQACVFPSCLEGELARMLELLAAADPGAPPIPDFEYPMPELVGQTYYVTHSVSAATSLPVTAQFPEHKVQILAYEAGALTGFINIRVRELKSFRRAS